MRIHSEINTRGTLEYFGYSLGRKRCILVYFTIWCTLVPLLVGPRSVYKKEPTSPEIPFRNHAPYQIRNHRPCPRSLPNCLNRLTQRRLLSRPCLQKGYVSGCNGMDSQYEDWKCGRRSAAQRRTKIKRIREGSLTHFGRLTGCSGSNMKERLMRRLSRLR